MPTFIGIDYHKAYSVYCVLDAPGATWSEAASITPARRISARWCDDGLDVTWSLKRV
jgi:hypothetical protein